MRRGIIVVSASVLMSARAGCGGSPTGGGTYGPPPSAPASGTPDGGSTITGPGGGADDVSRARIVRATTDVETILTAVEREREDTGSYNPNCLADLANLTSSLPPNACGSLRNCITAPPGDICWGGPYLNTIMVDPWANAYYATMNGALVIVGSAGPDGQIGTTDDIVLQG